MYHNIEKNIEKITKLNKESQDRYLRLFAKFDLGTKLKILNQQKQIFHKLKHTYDVPNVVMTLISLLLAVEKLSKNMDLVHFKAIKMRVKKSKINKKRQKLLAYWAIVRTLKLEQNMSFRQISDYFLKYHKFKISYSLIYQIWNELEENNKEK